MCNCVNVEMGSFDNQVRLITPEGKEVGIDRCIVNEIKNLWSLGIRTEASCCGHNKMIHGKRLEGVVSVTYDDIKKMKDLGYKHWDNPSNINREDGFLTKTIYN